MVRRLTLKKMKTLIKDWKQYDIDEMGTTCGFELKIQKFVEVVLDWDYYDSPVCDWVSKIKGRI